MEENDIFNFKLLKCEATTDLIELFDFEEGMHYFFKRNPNGVEYYQIILDSSEAKMMHECIKDLSIYFPRLDLYLEDYIFLRQQPNKTMIEIINNFTAEDLFDAYLHNAKLIKLRKKYLAY